MGFSQRLTDAAALTEVRLAALLDEAVAGGAPPRLVAAMRHGTLGGGTRLRPFLTVECARLFNVSPHAALETAAALECVHCYSLVHDDLPAMDDDDLRRGRPTVHKAFDEWTAILTGDALLTLAFELLATPRAHPDAQVRAELIAGLARASGAAGMAGGQCLDLEVDKLGTPAWPDIAHIQRLQAMKTGALIRYACEAGAILGQADASGRRALAQFGERLGAAFQIADDLLDVEGEAEVVGKATGKDARKATLVSLLGVAEARSRLGLLEAQAIVLLEPFGSAADVLREAARFVGERKA
jgi:farnesyl diphosphate synthase